MWTSLRMKCTSASPAASTFLTQSVLPWASPMASTLPLVYAVTMVSYCLPDVRPRCLITENVGRERANGLTTGLKYLVWNFSNQTGKSIGTPGALLGWSCRDMAAPFSSGAATVPVRYAVDSLWDNGRCERDGTHRLARRGVD